MGYKDNSMESLTTRKNIAASYSKIDTEAEIEDGLSDQTEKEGDECPLEQVLEIIDAKSRSLWRWRIASIISGLTLLAICFGFWVDYFQIRAVPLNADLTSTTAGLQYMPLSCGNTTEAAVRRDCAYNILSNRWLPKRCNVALSEHVEPMLKTIDAEPFRFYRDPGGSREIHEDDWVDIPLETIVWTTERHHITHCVNLLAQGAAGAVFGGMIEEHARDWDHVKHCADTILTAAKGLPGWNAINSFVKVRAGACY